MRYYKPASLLEPKNQNKHKDPHAELGISGWGRGLSATSFVWTFGLTPIDIDKRRRFERVLRGSFL